MDRRLVLRHLGPPAGLVLAYAGLYAMPVTLLGCLNRGLVFLGVVLLSAVGALTAMAVGIRRARRSREESAAWFLTAVALLLPSIAVLSVEVVLAAR